MSNSLEHFVKLELLPKAIYHRRSAEAQFYETYFAATDAWAEPTPQLAQTAFDIATMFGLLRWMRSMWQPLLP